MSQKKCLVLDLDNTLWGGTVGEDGMAGLALSLTPPGNSYVAFQQAILDLYNGGVILAINSRNNPEDALEVIRTHPNMLLREQHFAAMRINWQDKAQNIRELAHELNIGLDSMVFLDDDPTNRALVRSLVPEVEVPELPEDPTQYARFVHGLDFPAGALTDEDKMRGNLYVTERLRREEEKSHTSKEDFLASLSLELFIYTNDEVVLPRLSQLTEKTNQFNTLKRPLTEEELKRYMDDSDYAVYNGRLQDKFGDYGIIAFALVKKSKEEWVVESLLLSCRAFGREVEHAFMGTIAADARGAGARSMRFLSEETEKNVPAREFLESYTKGGTLSLTQLPPMPRWVKTHYGNV